MAQGKHKRRRKHRGTQAGTLDRTGRTGRPRTREEAKKISREHRRERLDRPPGLRGSVNRAAFAALLFGVLAFVVFGLAPGTAAAYTLFMFVLYIPVGYGTDKLLYGFRQRRKAAGK